MKKKLYKFFCSMFLVMITFLQLSCLYPHPVYADTSKAVFNQATGSLQIHYSDTVDDQEKAISGAEFSLYRIGDIDAYGNYKSLISSILTDLTADSQDDSIPEGIVDEDNNLQIDQIDEQAITALSEAMTEEYAGSVENNTVRVGKTDEDGELCFDNLELGLYLVVESCPAENHLASQPFLASIPYTEEGQNWQYDLEAEPKSVPCADLKIQKTVTGDGEKNRDFHFKISFNNLNQDDSDQPQTWTGVKSDGTDSEIKNGGIFTLQDGQTMTIEDIPVGTSYEVSEMEANQGGYTTTMEGNQGNISYTQENLVKFVNHKSTTTKLSSANPTSQSDTVKTSDTNKWFIYMGLFLCAAFAVILIMKKNKRLLSILLVIGIGSTLLAGGTLYRIHHTGVQKINLSNTENKVQEEDLSISSQRSSTDDNPTDNSVDVSADSSTKSIADAKENASSTSQSELIVNGQSSISDNTDKSKAETGDNDTSEKEELLPSDSGAIQIKLTEGGKVTVCDGDETTCTEEVSSVDESTNSSSETSNGNQEQTTSQLLTFDKSQDASIKLLITADDGYVISAFSHYENGEEINDGPSADDLSKNVTMIIPASQTTTYIEVSFTQSEVLTDEEEEAIAEEEEKLASGEMVLVSLMETDSDFAEDTMSDEIALASMEEDGEEELTLASTEEDGEEELTLASANAENDGESLLVSDTSLPSTITVYNTGHVINYSDYGGDSDETDLCHNYSCDSDEYRRTAYCVEPGKSSPVSDQSSATLGISSVYNANLYKVLYYGYGGPGDITGDIVGWSTNDFMIFTRLCVIYAYSGQNSDYTFQSCSDLMVSRTMDLWNLIMRQPDPINYMEFTPALQTVPADSDTSADITFKAAPGNSVNITMPAGVAIYNRTHPEYNWENGNTKIFAGDTFYLVTENNNYTFNPGILKGNIPSMLMFITESLYDTRQRLVGWIPETMQTSFQVHWCDNTEIKKSVDRQTNNIGQKQTWQIEAEIPNEPISSYEITDQLDQCLNYEGNVTVNVVQDAERRSTAYTGSSYIYKGIDWSPVFDPEWYSSYYPDVKKVYGDDTEGMLKHFIDTGIYQWHTRGRFGFDIDVYMNDPSNADLKAAFGNDVYAYYRHFCLYGVHEGRKCNNLIGTGEESQDTASSSPDYTASYDETNHTLTIHFEGNDNVLKNHLDKLTIEQNCKLVITFETSIKNQAEAGQEIENTSLLTVNGTSTKSNPARVYTGDAKVRKTDAEGNALTGAKFAIWSVNDGNQYPVVLDENNNPVNYGDDGYSQESTQMTAISDKDGTAVFHGLKDGQYVFKEIEAPEGYLLNDNKSDSVTISAGIVAETDIPAILDEKKTVPPSVKVTLNTGGTGDRWIRTCAAIFVMVSTILWIAVRRKFRVGDYNKLP